MALKHLAFKQGSACKVVRGYYEEKCEKEEKCVMNADTTILPPVICVMNYFLSEYSIYDIYEPSGVIRSYAKLLVYYHSHLYNG